MSSCQGKTISPSLQLSSLIVCGSLLGMGPCVFSFFHVSTSVSVSTSLVQVVFRQHVGETSWVYLFIFETVSSYVALASLNPYVNQASVELREIGLILPPKCCD